MLTTSIFVRTELELFFFLIHSDWSLYDLRYSIERFFLTSAALPCV